MKKITFKNCDGTEYEVILKKPHHSYKAIGTCDNPHEDNPKIHIDPTLKPIMVEQILTHEIIHAFFWEAPEYKVDKAAIAISKALKIYRKSLQEGQ